MNPADLEVLSLEDLDTLQAKLEAARSGAYYLPREEREKALVEIRILERELVAQQANQRRRLGSRRSDPDA